MLPKYLDCYMQNDLPGCPSTTLIVDTPDIKLESLLHRLLNYFDRVQYGNSANAPPIPLTLFLLQNPYFTDPNPKEFISESRLSKEVTNLAKQINHSYLGEDNLVCICVLKGAFLFFSDLMKQITIPCKCDFIKVHSYQGTESTSEIALTLEPSIDLKNKDILIVEDIVDTGRTARFLLDYFEKYDPSSIKICTLLDKPDNREIKVPLDFRGFLIPNHFVIGYGLDFDEKYRTLPYISIYHEP